MHTLLQIFLDAARGIFPSVDGGLTVLPPPAPGQRAVVAFTGHAIIAADIDGHYVRKLGADGFGGSLHPRVLSWLGSEGTIGVNDVTLVASGRGGARRLGTRGDLDDHHRVKYAREVRSNVEVLGDGRGLVTVGRGLAGRLEIGVETEPHLHGTGVGKELIEDGLSGIPEAEMIFAAVSPGNARSLRAFLAAGFVPIASEVIILVKPNEWPSAR